MQEVHGRNLPFTFLHKWVQLTRVMWDFGISRILVLHKLATSCARFSFTQVLQRLRKTCRPSFCITCTQLVYGLHKLCTAYAVCVHPLLHKLCTSYANCTQDVYNLHKTMMGALLHNLCTTYAKRNSCILCITYAKCKSRFT